MVSLFERGWRRLSCGVAAVALAVACALPAAAVQPVNIRLISDHPGPPHPAALAQEYFKHRIEESIPGSTVRLYYAGSLYNVPQAVEAMTNGDLEMTWGQFGKTSQVDPFMSVVVGPMLLTTAGAMDALDTLETYKMLVDRFDKLHGIKIFGPGEVSYFVGVGAGTRITKPEDFAGKKIRSPGPVENAALGAWGSNPTTMSFGDVPPALQTKVIDGLITSLGAWRSLRDQVPYFTVAGINGFSGDYYWLGASKIWWSKLDKDQQAAVEKIATEEMLPFQRKANWCLDKLILDQYGTTDSSKPGIYVLSEAEAGVLAGKLGDATQRWIKANSPAEAHPWVDKFVQEARAATKANPAGSNWLEKTDCAEMKPWIEKFTKKK